MFSSCFSLLHVAHVLISDQVEHINKLHLACVEWLALDPMSFEVEKFDGIC